jgi:hypothetical protein
MAPVTSLIDQLNAALKQAGILRSSFGEKYSVYSLRHFYAVNALRSGVAEASEAARPAFSDPLFCFPLSCVAILLAS